ncbi:DUF2073 domain-containing protein [archaeon]|jgi:hypothetical protein|nr:DUF2073 domain-containing protein [archaeon]MBT4648594.1 DUF2073 domain-containing protein [archaeon]MBT6821402.1 DUF2073 domain-containing protein [archaeon]MBT7392997.1 DUF2073 domain-containing protein [archaeon]
MLTLQFIPYAEISDLNSQKRIKKIITIVRENKIVLLEGRLKKEEEAELIRNTMESIDDDFKGIELAVIYPNNKQAELWSRLKSYLIKVMLGDREGFTIVGPATVVKEIKRDPGKIQLFTTAKVDVPVEKPKSKKSKEKK